ncbi:hypothetical protein TNCV_1006821 [Trichonephila clavipes]|nr:hypothetical protein TNCV_1006821 [Trichonephila clavipes]
MRPVQVAMRSLFIVGSRSRDDTRTENGERMDLRIKRGVVDNKPDIEREIWSFFPDGNCVFRTNRALMRLRAVDRLWWTANDKGRGACCGPLPGV